jgi:hypothetical protein
MDTEATEKKSQLITALREAVGVVQMILFKEIRAELAQNMPEAMPSHVSHLAGAITNEVFGTQNPDPKFVRLRAENWGTIEQEMLTLNKRLPDLCADITDALRIQTLCDHQEGNDSAKNLVRAKEFGFLQEERDVPLPSSFMVRVRILGEKHNLIVPPMQITAEQDTTMVH